MITDKAVIALLALGLLAVAGCSPVQAAPQDLAAATQKIVEQVKAEDNAVFEEIQRNIDMVGKLKADIESGAESSKQKQLNNVVNELERVTKSYEDLAARKEEIREGLLAKIAGLEELQEKVQTETARLNKQRDEYSVSLRTFTDPNPEIITTRKAALAQAIKYIDLQLQLWTEFGETEQQIRNETVAVQQRINSFLTIIESSAIVFREGLNLLKLQKDINDALSLFTQDMPRMEQLSRDMEQSWSHLDALVSTLTSMSLSITRS